MKTAVCVRVLFFVMIVLLGGMRIAVAASGDLVEVFIDARQPAYVTYQGVTEGTPQIARQEMAGYAALEGVSLVPWAEFSANVQNYIAPAIVKNEYPNARTALGLLAMLKAKPGRPVAITWNGGIATSFFDFQHAVEVYEHFRENDIGYENSRRQNVDEDPLNPDVQIKAMLGS